MELLSSSLAREILGQKSNKSLSHAIMRHKKYNCQENQQNRSVLDWIDLSEIKIKPGVYLGTVQSWKFGSGADTEKLGQCFFNVNDLNALDQKDSENLINEVITHGSHWETAHQVFNEKQMAETIIPNLETRLEDEFYEEIEKRKTSMEDRVSIQLATLNKEQRMSDRA